MIDRIYRLIVTVSDISTNVPHRRFHEAFSFKVFPKQVFDAPEAAGGHNAYVCCVRHALGHRCTIRIQTEAGGGGKGTHESSEKVGHCAGHEDDEDGDSEDFRVSKSRQIGE